MDRFRTVIEDDGKGGRVAHDGQALKAMAEEVKAVNEEKGWYDVNPKVAEYVKRWEEAHGKQIPAEDVALLVSLFGPRTFGDDIALLHSEVSEMLEAYRDNGLKETYEFKGAAADAMKEMGFTVAVAAGLGKPLGVASEAADVLVRLLDTCSRYDIDLFAAWRQKVDYNRTRPARHGGKRL